MTYLRRLLVGMVLSAVLLPAFGEAEASCGLDYCPLPNQAAARPSVGTFQVLVRHVDFSLPEGEGSYLENVLRLDFQRFKDWRLGGWIAPVFLSVGDESRSGLTNPVLFGERYLSLRESFSLLAGVQLELPLGDSHDGIASGHTELLGYVGGLYRSSGLEVQGQVGYAAAMSEGHAHEGGNALFVNPHADEEAQLRIAVVAPMLDGRLRPGATVNARAVVGDADEKNFVTGAFVASYQISSATQILGQVEVPVNSAHRFEWRGGVGVGLTL